MCYPRTDTAASTQQTHSTTQNSQLSILVTNTDTALSTSWLVPNSTTRTPATDMLYNTTNGQAHNNSTTCCTTNLPHRNAGAQHLDMSRCWDGCGKVLSVGGEFVCVVEFGI